VPLLELLELLPPDPELLLLEVAGVQSSSPEPQATIKPTAHQATHCVLTTTAYHLDHGMVARPPMDHNSPSCAPSSGRRLAWSR
jgi:hypothetical protein